MPILSFSWFFNFLCELKKYHVFGFLPGNKLRYIVLINWFQISHLASIFFYLLIRLEKKTLNRVQDYSCSNMFNLAWLGMLIATEGSKVTISFLWLLW